MSEPEDQAAQVKRPLSRAARRQIWILTILMLVILVAIVVTRHTPAPPSGAVSSPPASHKNDHAR